MREYSQQNKKGYRKSKRYAKKFACEVAEAAKVHINYEIGDVLEIDIK